MGIFGFVRICTRFHDVLGCVQRTSPAPKYKLAGFKDATMDQLLWEYRQLSRNSIKANSVQTAIEWIWQDIYSMRGEVHLDADKKYWFDHDIDACMQALFFPSVKYKTQ